MLETGRLFRGRNEPIDSVIMRAGMAPPTMLIDPDDRRSYDPANPYVMKDIMLGGNDMNFGDNGDGLNAMKWVNGRNQRAGYLLQQGGEVADLTWLRYKAASNAAWIDGLHKKSALWSLATWFYVGTITDDSPRDIEHIGTCNGSLTFGVILKHFGDIATTGAPGLLYLQIAKGGGSSLFYNNAFSSSGLSVPGWNFLGFSLTIPAAGTSASVSVYSGNRKEDAVSLSVTGTVSASNATYPLHINGTGAPAGGVAASRQGTRRGMWAAWSGVAYTVADFHRLRRLTQPRYIH